MTAHGVSNYTRTEVADFNERVMKGWEQGAGAVRFDPNFRQNNYFYLLLYQYSDPAYYHGGVMPNSAMVKAVFRHQLEKRQDEEILRGMTLVGPHRDDLRFLVGGVDMCTYGSRGQQRTISISLKLAEMELIRAKTREEPILLLDDVMSELDEARRRHLTDAIHGDQQVIITTTDLASFAPAFLQQASVWQVQEGRIDQSPD